jgi:PqqD family protein of HPr-rel-A system
VTRAQLPRVRDDLHVVELDGEAVVYDEATGDLHHLNAVATVVLDLCDGSATAREVARDVALAFEEAPPDVERHVRRCIREFRSVGLLERNGGDRRG